MNGIGKMLNRYTGIYKFSPMNVHMRRPIEAKLYDHEVGSPYNIGVVVHR